MTLGQDDHLKDREGKQNELIIRRASDVMKQHSSKPQYTIKRPRNKHLPKHNANIISFYVDFVHSKNKESGYVMQWRTAKKNWQRTSTMLLIVVSRRSCFYSFASVEWVSWEKKHSQSANIKKLRDMNQSYAEIEASNKPYIQAMCFYPDIMPLEKKSGLRTKQPPKRYCLEKYRANSGVVFCSVCGFSLSCIRFSELFALELAMTEILYRKRGCRPKKQWPNLRHNQIHLYHCVASGFLCLTSKKHRVLLESEAE